MLFKNSYAISSNKLNLSLVKIIHVYKYLSNKSAIPGSFLRNLSKNFFFKKSLRKNFKKIAIFCRSFFKRFYIDLTYLIFFQNSTFFLKKRLTPLSSYIYGPSYFKIKRKKYQLSFNKVF